jgi:hypothetical protein
MQLAYLRAIVGAAAARLLYFNTISDVVASLVEFCRFTSCRHDSLGTQGDSGDCVGQWMAHGEVLRNSEAYSEDLHPSLLGYITAARSEDVSIANKAANLMAALIHAPAMLEPARLFYFKMLGQFDLQSIEGRRGRLAYLAVEGAFLLRVLGLKTMTEDEWLGILADAQDMYLGA